ncbi:MAG: BatD family protein [Oscillospiraceae bacterium]|nr:BatD family protein [Oscillospiraceae bacterium]
MAGKARKMAVLGLALFVAVLFSVPAYAARGPSFRLDMESLNLRKGVSCNLVITLENAQGAKVSNIEGLEEFDLVSQSSSTSTTIMNGAATHQDILYYTIMPKSTGQFTLKANIQYNGSIYETNALQVTVGDSSGSEGEGVQDLFVKTVLSHTDAYMGEKVIVTYILYSRYNIDYFGFEDTISIDDAIIKNTPKDRLKSEYVYLEGERYAMYEVMQLIIDPIRLGVCVLPSFNFRVDVITGGGTGGGFGALFRSSTPVYIQTEEKELTVKPLPSEGKPADFSGIVGELQIDSSYSREQMNYGESCVLSVTVSGSCNLDGLKNIINIETPGFSVYETLKNTDESVKDDRYNVQKTFDVILVPEKTGVLNFPPISVSYFNSVTEKYETAEIPGIAATVLGDMPQPGGNNSGQAFSTETVRIEQVNYTDPDDGYFRIQMKKAPVYWALAAFAILVILAVVLIRLSAKRKKQDAILKSTYKRLMAAKDVNETYDLLNIIIKHCYSLSLKASSQNIIRNSLPDAALGAQLAEIMDYVESSESRDAKGHMQLKDKIKSIYPVIVKNN